MWGLWGKTDTGVAPRLLESMWVHGGAHRRHQFLVIEVRETFKTAAIVLIRVMG